MIISSSFQKTRLALISVSLMLITGGYPHASKAPVESPWKGSGLDFRLLEDKLNTKSCRQTRERFLACIAAVQSLLDTSPRRLQIVHVNWLFEGGAGYQWQRRFGEVALVETAQDEHINVLDEISARRQRILAWRQDCCNAEMPRADFRSLLDWVRQELVGQGQLEHYTAAAINGYLSIKDAHAKIVPASASPSESVDTASPQGENVVLSDNGIRYSGIGASIHAIAGNIIVNAVVQDSPASAAGIQASDVLLAVDGISVEGKSVPEVVAALRGSAGTVVSLRVKRQEQVYETRLRRARLNVRNVSSAVLDDRGWSWGYLRIGSFISGSTCTDARRELRSLQASGVDGVLLDLRNNMGGLIEQAVCVADLFLEPRMLVLEIRSTRRHGNSRHLYSRRGAVTDAPLVTLVNAATGSASEALAGALQDHGRSLVIGERTFGKGTIQTLRPWNDSGSVMFFFTTARMYTPAGRTTQLVGIEPDLQVTAEPDGSNTERTILREEDLFPTALPSPLEQPERRHHWNLAGMDQCVETEGLAGKRWLGRETAGGDRDYRLYVGYDLLHCLQSDEIAMFGDDYPEGPQAFYR